MGNFLKTWFTVLRGREKLRNERLLVAFVFGAESVVLPPQSTIRNQPFINQSLRVPSWSFVTLHGPLSSLFPLFQPLGAPSRTPCPTFGGSLLSLLQPLRGPSPFFVALRGYLFAFSWKSFLPLAAHGGSLSSLLQPLRGPSLFFVALRGYLFAFSWKSFLPLAILGRPLSSFLQPLSGPFWSFVSLRG